MTSQFNGGGRMPTPDASNPLWEPNFKAYTVVNAQITKYFRQWSIYVGAENLFNYKQPNPIIDASNPRGITSMDLWCGDRCMDGKFMRVSALI